MVIKCEQSFYGDDSRPVECDDYQNDIRPIRIILPGDDVDV